MALKLQPDNADSHMQIGLVYEDLGRNENAERAFFKAIELDSEEVTFREYLASFYERRNRLADAAQQYEQILEIDPEHAGAQLALEQITKKIDPDAPVGTGMGGQ